MHTFTQFSPILCSLSKPPPSCDTEPTTTSAIHNHPHQHHRNHYHQSLCVHMRINTHTHIFTTHNKTTLALAVTSARGGKLAKDYPCCARVRPQTSHTTAHTAETATTAPRSVWPCAVDGIIVSATVLYCAVYAAAVVAAAVHNTITAWPSSSSSSTLSLLSSSSSIDVVVAVVVVADATANATASQSPVRPRLHKTRNKAKRTHHIYTRPRHYSMYINMYMYIHRHNIAYV